MTISSASDIGISARQAIIMSWSKRKRGRLQRTHMNTKMMSIVFAKNTSARMMQIVKLGVTAFTLEWDGHVQAMTGRREFWAGNGPINMRQPAVRIRA